MNSLIKAGFATLTLCCIFGNVSALTNPNSAAKSEDKSEKIPRPLYYDIIDNTDVLAIPSDSSGWDQEDEVEHFEDQSEEYLKKNKQNPPK